MASKFEIYQDKSGRFRWRLRAGNGEILAVSEAYESERGAIKGIEATQRAVAETLRTDRA